MHNRSKGVCVRNYPFIDGLRALAVLPIIFFHMNLPLFSGGFIGVDVFFVISGFLITGLLFEMIQENRFSIIHFYERRARRILPALFFTCLICVFFALLMFMPDDFRSFSKSLKGVAGFASNFIFARWVGYFAATAPVDPLLHTWSLAVEEQFYLIFPLIIYVIIRFFSHPRTILSRVMYVLFWVSLALNLLFISTSPERTFYLLHSRAWELLAGSILALRLQKINLTAGVAETMGITGLVILLACIVLYDRNTIFPGMAALLPVAATVLLLWSNLKHATVAGRLLSTNLLIKVGLISYGLYLYHWPVIVFARYYFDRPVAPTDALWALPLIALMAIASYAYIEQPVRSGSVLIARKSLFWFSGLGIVLIGLMGWAGIAAEGFPRRFDKAVLQYAAGASDVSRDKNYCRPLPPDVKERNVCVFGAAKKKPNFLVWGDSHAGMMQPALATLAKKYHLTGWMVYAAGCPSLFGVEREDHHVNFSCRDIGEQVRGLIQRNKIKKVLLVTRWDMYALGWEAGSIETTRNPVLSFQLPEGRKLTGKKAFAAAFHDTAKALQQMGVTVWVMKQVPPQLANVPSALAKAAYLGRDPHRLERSYAEVLKRRSFIDETFADVPLFYIDPLSVFCTVDATCRIELKGHPLYTDHGHLSAFGALWSKDMLALFFKAH